MAKKFEDKKLVIASHNKGKIEEISELLKPYGVKIIAGTEFNLDEPEETGQTFVENAEIKSRYFAGKTGLPSLSDDSGLSVDALDGAPGIYSARWAGSERDFNLAMKKVEKSLVEKAGKAQGQSACFVCALSLCWPDGHVENFEGKAIGSLIFPPQGDKGFGYDPIFAPNGYGQTFAEMQPEQKHKLSHRANALQQLVNACFK